MTSSTESTNKLENRLPEAGEEPTAELLAELAEHSQRLDGKSPEQILEWTIDTFFPKLTMATAFGAEGCVIMYMVSQINPNVPIFNLDTGYQFKETLVVRDQFKKKYGIDVELKRPDWTVEEYEKMHGGPIYKSDPTKCCFDNKIQVLHKSVVGYDAWMSSIRRDQSVHRAEAPIVGWDKKFGLVKVSPIANWTKKEVWNKIVEEGVPYNVLHDQGYQSIGCWPCTRETLEGEDERAGRWSGTAKTECGLHLMD